MIHLEQTFEAFFNKENQDQVNVVVIKGEWGVGKTHFWDTYISKRISQEDLSQIAYSYISLFGKSSLEDVRKSVFHNTTPIRPDDQVKEAFETIYDKSSRLLHKIPWLGKISEHSQNIPLVGKMSGLISSLEYSLVDNYIICFDDLERKGTGLSIKELMGFVDELAIRKNCKVVLIFNEESLKGEDKEQFESYREKVVDLEVNYNPTCNENLTHIFPASSDGLSVIQDVVDVTDLKNIRVLRKIKWAFEKFSVHFEEKDARLKDEGLLHIALFCWVFYIQNSDLGYEELKKELSSESWLAHLAHSDEEKSTAQKQYRLLASNLHLESSLLDPHICFFLENGYIDKGPLLEAIDELAGRLEIETANSKLKAAWALYRESFADNGDEFYSIIRSVLDEDIPRLGLGEFGDAVGALEGIDLDCSQYIFNYIDHHSDALREMDFRDSHANDIMSTTLREAIEKLRADKAKVTLDEVVQRLADSQGWNPESIDFLCSQSIDDFKSWMKSEPENLGYKIRRGLFVFGNLGSTEPTITAKHKTITGNVHAALKEIAEENDFNRQRIENLYNLEF